MQAAEAAKGFDQRDFKEYFQYYQWGRCPGALEPVGGSLCRGRGAGRRIADVYC